MARNNVYSFLNCAAAIAGPGGVVDLGAGAAAAEEGITVEPVEDKNVMTVGADGQGQHSLIASDAKKVTVRLLKTSPVNAALMIMYNVQSATSKLWGQNVITVRDTVRGDVTPLQGCAFRTPPTLNYQKEAGFNDWVFDCITGNTILGGGN